MKKMIEEKSKEIDPDVIGRIIYDSIKENQKCFKPESKIFKNQSFFIIIFVNAIRKLEGTELKNADNNQLLEFFKELSNIKFEFFNSLIKCSKKSEYFENLVEYKFEICLNWIKYICLRLNKSVDSSYENFDNKILKERIKLV